MNMREFERQLAQRKTLESLGFTAEEAAQLRRISMTLQRWHELECGTDAGCIERDEKTNKAYWLSESGKRWPYADRETGALKRLAAIIKARNIRQPKMEDPLMNYYIQGDPRGAALYILRPGDVPEGKDASAYYSRGICVY